MLHQVRRAPRPCGYDRPRWRLADLLASCPWLRLRTTRGLGRLLRRLGISYQRGRDYIHSPDPDYAAKLAAVATAQAATAADPAGTVLLYLDELTVGRQPTLAPAWEERDRVQPRAHRSQRSDTITRLVGALNHQTGALHVRRATAIALPTFVAFLQQVRAAYPTATRIYLVVDNWAVHFHPDVLVACAPQETPFVLPVPANWPTVPRPAAVRKWGGLALPIQLVPLPTYASWCNPIEQVWRKLRQELGHLHPWADALDELRAHLDAWCAPYAAPSPELLHYVGLGLHD